MLVARRQNKTLQLVHAPCSSAPRHGIPTGRRSVGVGTRAAGKPAGGQTRNTRAPRRSAVALTRVACLTDPSVLNSIFPPGHSVIKRAHVRWVGVQCVSLRVCRFVGGFISVVALRRDMSDDGSCVTLIFYRINPKWWKEPALNLASAVAQMSNLTHCEISLGEVRMQTRTRRPILN